MSDSARPRGKTSPSRPRYSCGESMGIRRRFYHYQRSERTESAARRNGCRTRPGQGERLRHRGRDIPAAKAWEYVGGFTIINDLSARNLQRAEMDVGLGPAKGKDFATAVG